MTPEQSAALRVEFPRNQVHQIPRKNRQTGQTVQLDYVGHAEVTDRLLSVDPEWYWEPMGRDEQGLPAMVLAANGQPVGLWISLTVCGVTRFGFGSVGADAFEPEKQLIGDAIRNAAMRFGVALDLWAKSDLHDAGAPAGAQPHGFGRHLTGETTQPWTKEEFLAELRTSGVSADAVCAVLGKEKGEPWSEVQPVIDAWLKADEARTIKSLISTAADKAAAQPAGAWR